MKNNTKKPKKHFKFGAVAISTSTLKEEKLSSTATSSLQPFSHEVTQEESKTQQRLLEQPLLESELHLKDTQESVEEKVNHVPEYANMDNKHSTSNSFNSGKETDNNPNMIEVTEMACDMIAEVCESSRRDEMAVFMCYKDASTSIMQKRESTLEQDVLKVLKNKKMYIHIYKSKAECSTFLTNLLDQIKRNTREDVISGSTTANYELWKDLMELVYGNGCTESSVLATSTTLQSSALPQIPYAQMYSELEEIKKESQPCHVNVDCSDMTSMAEYESEHMTLLASWSHILQEVLYSVLLTWIELEGNTALHTVEWTFCNTATALYDWVCNVAKQVSQLINTLDDTCRTRMVETVDRHNSISDVSLTEVCGSNATNMPSVEFECCLAIFDQCLCANTCFLR